MRAAAVEPETNLPSKDVSHSLPQMDADPNCTSPVITSTPKKINYRNVNTVARNLIARQEKQK